MEEHPYTRLSVRLRSNSWTQQLHATGAIGAGYTVVPCQHVRVYDTDRRGAAHETSTFKRCCYLHTLQMAVSGSQNLIRCHSPSGAASKRV